MKKVELNVETMRARVAAEMVDSLDEELEMEIDDGRLGDLLKESSEHSADSNSLDRVHGEFVNHAAIGIWNRPRQWLRQA
jgi:hypothetical protein